MNRPDNIPFSDEQIQAVREASEIQKMIELPAWRWFEDRLAELVSQSCKEVLKVNTSDPIKALDAVRRWQLNDEVISTIRSEISSKLSARDALVEDPNDQMAVLIKEHLNG